MRKLAGVNSKKVNCCSGVHGVAEMNGSDCGDSGSEEGDEGGGIDGTDGAGGEKAGGGGDGDKGGKSCNTKEANGSMCGIAPEPTERK